MITLQNRLHIFLVRLLFNLLPFLANNNNNNGNNSGNNNSGNNSTNGIDNSTNSDNSTDGGLLLL